MTPFFSVSIVDFEQVNVSWIISIRSLPRTVLSQKSTKLQKHLNGVNQEIDPTGVYLFKINNGNNRTICDICNKKDTRTTSHVTVVSFLLILNRFYLLLWCFYWWFVTYKYRLCRQKLSKDFCFNFYIFKKFTPGIAEDL